MSISEDTVERNGAVVMMFVHSFLSITWIAFEDQCFLFEVFVGYLEVSMIGNWYWDWVTSEAWSCLCFYRHRHTSQEYRPYAEFLSSFKKGKQEADCNYMVGSFPILGNYEGLSWYAVLLCISLVSVMRACVVNIIISLHLSIISFSLCIARISWSRRCSTGWMQGEDQCTDLCWKR